MKKNQYARKKRQLKWLAKRLNILIEKGASRTSREVNKMVLKIKLLLGELAGAFSKFELKSVLGGLAIGLGVFYSGETTAQSFRPPVLNPFGLVSTFEYAMPAFADLDGDGDLDLLVGEYYGSMQYFENTGTSSSPNFASPSRNPFGIVSTSYLAYPNFADMDNDGDLDLFVGEVFGGMKYFENKGSSTSPQFIAPVMNPFGLSSTLGFAVPVACDLDGDGDLDLLVGETYGVLQYFENTGSVSSPVFAAPVQNPFGLTSGSYISAATVSDIDNDGDLDVIVGEAYGALQYFENTGSVTTPYFAIKDKNPFGLQSAVELASPVFVDLDADGDVDLLVGEYYGGMQFFKNDLINGVSNVSMDVEVGLFPNPVVDVLNIEITGQIEMVEIFNLLGQSMGQYKKPGNKIDISNLSSGMYTVKIELSNGQFSIQKFKMQ